MSEYAAQHGRPPFVAGGRVVVRRESITREGTEYKVGEDLPCADMTARQIGILWDQGRVDTLPAAKPPKRDKRDGDAK